MSYTGCQLVPTSARCRQTGRQTTKWRSHGHCHAIDRVCECYGTLSIANEYNEYLKSCKRKLENYLLPLANIILLRRILLTADGLKINARFERDNSERQWQCEGVLSLVVQLQQVAH